MIECLISLIIWCIVAAIILWVVETLIGTFLTAPNYSPIMPKVIMLIRLLVVLLILLAVLDCLGLLGGGGVRMPFRRYDG